MKYYPINLDLARKRCVVVGGGRVAERKIRTLLEFQAAVTVVAPWVNSEIAELIREGKISHKVGEYESRDLEGATLVIGATNDRTINSRISTDAENLGVLVNIVDDPALCNFILPSVLIRGDVVIGISTGGSSPLLSKKIKKQIESVIGDEYGILAALMGRLRPEVKQTVEDEEERIQIWHRILDSDVLELIRQGRLADAEKRARECILS